LHSLRQLCAELRGVVLVPLGILALSGIAHGGVKLAGLRDEFPEFGFHLVARVLLRE
jgi:hypothetical protein